MSIAFAEDGAADDSSLTAGLVTDTGIAADSAFTIAATLTLTEAGAADDQPWEYASAGVPVFPYYADLPAAAAGRVNVGDHFLWYAAG